MDSDAILLDHAVGARVDAADDAKRPDARERRELRKRELY